jgi:hypothetical protein
MSDRSREEVIRANPNLPLLALPREEAAAALGISAKTFDRLVRPDVQVIRRGGLLLFLVSDLVRWGQENAGRAVEDVAA